MTDKIKITHYTSKECWVCDEMKPEMNKFNKECKPCNLKKVDVDKVSSKELKDIMEKNGDVFVPAVIIEKNGKKAVVRGFASAAKLKKIAEGL